MGNRGLHRTFRVRRRHVGMKWPASQRGAGFGNNRSFIAQSRKEGVWSASSGTARRRPESAWLFSIAVSMLRILVKYLTCTLR